MIRPLILSVLALGGCNTNPEYFKAQAEYYKMANQPSFECDKCEGLKIYDRDIKPLSAPTNGWDFGKSMAGVLNNNLGMALGVVALDRVMNSVTSLGTQDNGDMIATTTTTTSTTTDTNTNTSIDIDNSVSNVDNSVDTVVDDHSNVDNSIDDHSIIDDHSVFSNTDNSIGF